VGNDHNETAANIKTALNSIPLPNGVSVTSVTYAAGGPYTVTFSGTPGAATLQPIDFTLPNNAAFTGGTGAIATLTEGKPPLSAIPVNDVQTLDLTTATAGDYKLTYDGHITGAIPLTAGGGTAAGSIYSFLTAVDPDLVGNIVVTATTAPAAPNGGKFTIEFVNKLAGKPVDIMGLNKTGITAGTASIATTTPGKEIGYPIAADSIPFTKQVFDSQGNPRTLNMRFFKYEVDPGSIPNYTPTSAPVTRWACDISLDSKFEKQDDYNTNDDLRAIDFTQAPSTTTASDEKITRIYNIDFDKNGNIILPTANSKGIATLSVNLQDPVSSKGTDNLTVAIDFSKISQTAGSNTVWAESQDGFAQGSLTSYSIGVDGIITGSYDNGQKQALAQINMASFENPSGLQQIGGTIFAQTVNSGDANLGVPGAGGKGSLTPGSL